MTYIERQTWFVWELEGRTEIASHNYKQGGNWLINSQEIVYNLNSLTLKLNMSITHLKSVTILSGKAQRDKKRKG